MSYTLITPYTNLEGNEVKEIEVQITMRSKKLMPIHREGAAVTFSDVAPCVLASCNLTEKEFYNLSLEDRAGLIAEVFEELGK